jgi:LysM repeat protein
MIAAAALLSACQIDVPIKSMVEAKNAITLAGQYQAEKYAKEEFDAAAKALLSAHEFIKNEKTDDAKKSADESKKKADEALAKTLPLLSKDTLDAAKTAFDEVTALSAEEFAKEKYAEADALVKDASAKYEAKEYIPCYETALKAKDAADATKTAVLLNVPVIKARLSKIHDSAAEIRAAGGNTSAKESLDGVDEKVAEGEAALSSSNLKNASAAAAAAEDLLAKARTDVRKAAAGSKIAAAEEGYAKVQGSGVASSFTDRLALIAAAIADAKVLSDAGTFEDADAKASEALAMVDALAIDMQKKEEEDRAAKALADEQESARVRLAAEAKAKADADAQIKTDVKTEPEIKAETVEPSREYVVIYNPKSSDCLWKIAEKMYKNANLWPLIFMANRAQIKDPDLIYPGQKFSIPPVPKRADPAKESDAVKKPEPAKDGASQ